MKLNERVTEQVLRPCPFCGHEAKMEFREMDDPNDPNDASVTCSNFECEFGGWWVRPSVWNKRPVEDALGERVEKLESMVERMEVHHLNQIDNRRFTMKLNEYVFYTIEGEEYSPDGSEVHNCQMLEFVSARDLKEAWKIFLDGEAWARAEDLGFQLSYVLVAGFTRNPQ